ncbi:hypothetical protein QTP86_024217, partial [Hemibagrus guttatus]
MPVVCLPLSAGEDSFELHSVDLELEAAEKQIRDLQVKQAQLRQRKATLESSQNDVHLSQTRTSPPPPPPIFEISTRNRFAPLRERDTVIIRDSIVRHVRATMAKDKVRTRCLPGARVLDVSAQVPAILNKNIGAVVLHAGMNNIRLRQTKDFRSLVEKACGKTRIVMSGPHPTFRRGIERFSTLFTFNEWLQSWCQDHKLPFVDNWNLFWERPRLCTQAELEQQSSQTTSPGHYTPSD